MRYLNFILTIIALCLIYQCVRGSATPVQAGLGGAIQKGKEYAAELAAQDPAAQGYREAVPVEIVNLSIQPVPVRLEQISGLCDAIKVKPGRRSASLPVVIKDQ